MAEVLVGAAVELLVGPAVESLLSVVSENIRLISGFEDQLGRLKDEAEMIQAVLDDAERRSPQDKAVRLWLKRLADFAYEAYDVLDKFAYHALRRKVEKVSSFMPSSSKPSFLSKRKMGKKIKELLTSLEKIKKQADDYKLQTGGGHAHALPPHVVREGRDTASRVDVSEKVMGREDDIIKIVQMLTSESNQQYLSILPIVGMGGQGKTTLAKQIYNNDRVENHFQKRIWVCVSDEFNVKSLLKEILVTLVKKKCELNTKETILHELCEVLGGQKYLLVLDDVWEENQENWDEFVSDLRSTNTSGGNTILVTTRSYGVGNIVGTFDQPYSLEGLSDDDCWSIFSARAFPDEVLGDYEAIGRDIVKKCRGLPLAAKVVGSMLRSKRDIEEWKSIANSGAWNYGSDSRGVLSILKLSYDNLSSSSLKRCFSYCSIFIKDSVMEKDELIQQWMALGYLQPLEAHDNMQMEDIGNRYFNILVGRSLLQDITTNFFGDIESCKMHDLVHDLAQSLSKSDIFVVEGSAELERGRIPHDIRHLASYSGGVNLDTIGQQVGVKLRTLFFDNIEIGKGFVNFKSLRVLKLLQIEKLPTSVGELIHLRYLDLSKTGIQVLPDSISKLYHLQTLRLPFHLGRFPDGIRNLISLRHLFVNKSGVFVQLPPKLGSLTWLQTLPRFDVDEDRGNQIEELGSLENLRGELRICNLDAVRSKEDAKRANLSQKTKIYGLIFHWREKKDRASQSDNDCDDGVWEGLQPPPNLKSLCLDGFRGKKFPDWVMNMAVNIGGSQLLLDNLMDIQLRTCKRIEGIPMLGHLPNLRRLGLHGLVSIKCIDESFYGYRDSSNCRKTIKLFPALEELRLGNMENLEEWMGATASQEEVVVFPCLQMLIVYDCLKLKTAPIHFPSLKQFSFIGVESGSALVSICSSSTLTALRIESVAELIYLPDALFHNNRHHLMKMIINNCGMLESLPQGLQSCTSLRSLNVGHCRKLKSIPSLEGLNSLTDMDCSDCEMLECLPQGPQSLCSLNVRNCRKLKSISSLEGLNSLTDMDCSGCEMLECLRQGPQSLCSLNVRNCHKLKSISSLEGLNSLTDMDCSGCEMLEFLPQGLQSLRSLSVINCKNLNLMASVEDINGCHKVTSLPSLETLDIGGTTSFKYIQHLLPHCISLCRLTLTDQPECDTLPEQLQYLTALTSIELLRFGVEALPDWFGKLESLEEIVLYSMKKLKCLPSKEAMQRLTKLREMTIEDCPLLEARCKEGDCPEWSKISTIPVVWFC